MQKYPSGGNRLDTCGYFPLFYNDKRHFLDFLSSDFELGSVALTVCWTRSR